MLCAEFLTAVKSFIVYSQRQMIFFIWKTFFLFSFCFKTSQAIIWRMDNFFGKKMTKMEQKVSIFSKIYKFFENYKFFRKLQVFFENYNIFRKFWKLQVFSKITQVFSKITQVFSKITSFCRTITSFCRK